MPSSSSFRLSYPCLSNLKAEYTSRRRFCRREPGIQQSNCLLHNTHVVVSGLLFVLKSKSVDYLVSAVFKSGHAFYFKDSLSVSDKGPNVLNEYNLCLSKYRHITLIIFFLVGGGVVV